MRRVAGFSRATADDDAQPQPAEVEPPQPGDATAPPSADADAHSDSTSSTSGGGDAAPAAALEATPPDRRPRPRRSADTNGSKAQRGGEVAKPGGHRHQTNFRLFDSEASYLKQLRRDFEDHGIDTDVTELVHALVYAARRGEVEPLELLRRWRRDFNEI